MSLKIRVLLPILINDLGLIFPIFPSLLPMPAESKTISVFDKLIIPLFINKLCIWVKFLNL